jgi:hypothetical protein
MATTLKAAPRGQRDVAGRHYLTKAEINALYFATHLMKRPRGWDSPFSVGRYWRAALVVFFNYGVDTGTHGYFVDPDGNTLRVFQPDPTAK